MVNATAWEGLLAEGIVDDPWLGGKPRLDPDPVILDVSEAADIAEAACSLAMFLDEAVPAVAAEPALIGLDASVAAVAALDAPRWLALARADVFLCSDAGRAQVCEINCDTPTGVAECVELGRLAAPSHPAWRDPSAHLRERWLEMILSCARERPVVGIVDPTEMTEDLCHVRLLTRWLEDAGCTVVRGSPFNLHACPGSRVGLFGTSIDVLLRHYKTDWWANRGSVWLDEAAPPHAEPLTRELRLVAEAMSNGNLAVVNPWGAAIAQNKRSLALPWEHPDLFRPSVVERVRRHVPESRFLESLPLARLISERVDWVLKSDYGCEGDEVLLGRHTDPDAWERSLRLATPGRWIVQRAFHPRCDAEGISVNHGVYLIGGRPSGIYTRRSRGPTDIHACSCSCLVRA